MKRSSCSAAEPTDALAGCQPRSASSADQLASNRTVAQLTSNIAKESVLLILCYLGAHNLNTVAVHRMQPILVQLVLRRVPDA